MKLNIHNRIKHLILNPNPSAFFKISENLREIIKIVRVAHTTKTLLFLFYGCL